MQKSQRMTREQLMDWAADNYRTEQNCEGTPEQALMAGWVHAMDTCDSRYGCMTDAEWLDYAYSEFDNMGYSSSDLT